MALGGPGWPCVDTTLNCLDGQSCHKLLVTVPLVERVPTSRKHGQLVSSTSKAPTVHCVDAITAAAMESVWSVDLPCFPSLVIMSSLRGDVGWSREGSEGGSSCGVSNGGGKSGRGSDMCPKLGEMLGAHQLHRQACGSLEEGWDLLTESPWCFQKASAVELRKKPPRLPWGTL